MAAPKEVNSINLTACRVCLDSKFSNGIVLDINSEWLRVFEYCVGLTIDSNEVSRSMCRDCAHVLTNFAEFKKQCYKSHKIWKSLKLEAICNLGNKIKIEKVSKHSESTLTYDNNLCADTENISIKTENNDVHMDNQEYVNVEYLEKFCNEINNEDVNYGTVLEFGIEKDLTSNNSVKEFEKLPNRKVNVKRKKRKAIINRKKLQMPVLSIPSVHYCGLCDVTSSDIIFISKHIEEHGNNKEIHCKCCEYEGRDFADMVSHRYNHYPNDIKIRLSCHICNKTCRHSRILQFHYRSVHLGKPGGWCTVCNKTFIRYKYWRNHERLHKEETKKYICDHCGRHYLFRNQLEAHWQDISDVKPHICDVCGRRFKRFRNMMSHLSTAHVAEPIKCTHCNKTYKNKVNLDLHMKTVLRNKNYICEVCSRSFPTRYTLKNHMLWHADERPYACEFCDVKYKVKSQLRVHMRSHTGILPFKCDYCERCFATSKQKRVHASVHTGIRAHKCLYCERSFHDRKKLREHYLAQHQPPHVMVSSCKE